MKIELTFKLPTDQPTCVDRGTRKNKPMSVEGRAKRRTEPAPSSGEWPRQPLPAIRLTLPKPPRQAEPSTPETISSPATPTVASQRQVMPPSPLPNAPPPVKMSRRDSPTVPIDTPAVPMITDDKPPTPEPTPAPEPTTPALRQPWTGEYDVHKVKYQTLVDDYTNHLEDSTTRVYDNPIGITATTQALRPKHGKRHARYLIYDQASTISGECYLLGYKGTPEYNQAKQFWQQGQQPHVSYVRHWVNIVKLRRISELRPSEAFRN